MFTKKRVILLIILAAICIITPVLGIIRGNGDEVSGEDMTVLTVWQIDTFEGGRGSRAQYLQNKADEYFKDVNCYVTVTTISSEAAKENLANGNIPDMISYGAGFIGLESYINNKDYIYKTWCRGGYCLITIDESADFTDISEQNTIINQGKENLVLVTAMFLGVNNAAQEKPTGAYVDLINGKYKYLLGTQRDIYRFKSRNLTIKVKPINEFNDLYQNISILTNDPVNYSKCSGFISYLTENNEDADKIGMFADGKTIYSDEMHAMETLTFDYSLQGLISENYKNDLMNCISAGDINLLKSLLK